jgi:Beta-lactamase enzyme family
VFPASEPRRIPAHAGRLRGWEQCVFALVFAVMASYVLVVSVSAARANQAGVVAAGKAGATSVGQTVHHPARHTGAARTVHRPLSLDARLAAAMGPIARSDHGDIAVGIFDETSGKQASFHSGMRFHSASVENADMLATLLLQYQRAGMSLSPYAAMLATDMMEYSDNDAANAVWDLEGGLAGLQAANKTLGLRQTRLGAGGYWGLTSTTVNDQLRLLADLTGSHSPLHAAARRYALGLMSGAMSGQRWGACAVLPKAASRGTGCAIRDGWVPDPVRWVINSIGVVRLHGQELLIAVLSKGNRTEAGGTGLVRAAAVAAARVITSD